MDQYSLDRIADRLEIQDNLFKWCRAVDRLDSAGMLDVFHDDAIDEHGHFNGPVSGLVEWISERHREIPFSSHQVSNVLIEFVTQDTAFVESYVRTLQRYPAKTVALLRQLMPGAPDIPDGLSADLMTSSRYLDRVEKRQGSWKITHRKLSQDWKQLWPAPANNLEAKASWLTQRRDLDDAVYVERAKMGIA
ncbi:nuclear transport factor 2 family protein [Oceanicola sp. 502str15]|uniref:nuclear transport factor 2 family protein n=1 Tax=Oceanicola sp. 502str15 TaxID=2696061 RepID=UPI002094E406|nr:nuclear transport factor 2 family protein [Oceanicola sp. 502str15]MCO6385309.1 nuclear transport factor 2 family protein [Oceanicola sp. 502str15]